MRSLEVSGFGGGAVPAPPPAAASAGPSSIWRLASFASCSRRRCFCSRLSRASLFFRSPSAPSLRGPPGDRFGRAAANPALDVDRQACQISGFQEKSFLSLLAGHLESASVAGEIFHEAMCTCRMPRVVCLEDGADAVPNRLHGRCRSKLLLAAWLRVEILWLGI